MIIFICLVILVVELGFKMFFIDVDFCKFVIVKCFGLGCEKIIGFVEVLCKLSIFGDVVYCYDKYNLFLFVGSIKVLCLLDMLKVELIEDLFF